MEKLSHISHVSQLNVMPHVRVLSPSDVFKFNLIHLHAFLSIKIDYLFDDAHTMINSAPNFSTEFRRVWSNAWANLSQFFIFFPCRVRLMHMKGMSPTEGLRLSLKHTFTQQIDLLHPVASSWPNSLFVTDRKEHVCYR